VALNLPNSYYHFCTLYRFCIVISFALNLSGLEPLFTCTTNIADDTIWLQKGAVLSWGIAVVL
jgi:hypothetical protein